MYPFPTFPSSKLNVSKIADSRYIILLIPHQTLLTCEVQLAQLVVYENFFTVSNIQSSQFGKRDVNKVFITINR